MSHPTRPASKDALAHVAETTMRARGFLAEPPADALAEAASVHSPVAGDGPRVRDLRALAWSSIDNVESRDLDQIEAAEAIEGGGFRLYVGIADVDVFAPAGSALDRFAAHNTTSVYTGARVFPMLPERLSFDLSSLLDDKVRQAVVIETTIAADGSLAEGTGCCKVYVATVENKAKLAYPSVSAWLDGTGPIPAPLARDAAVAAQVRLHDRIAITLGAARARDGALDLDTGELRATVDEHGTVTGLAAHHQDRAGRVIEELMIASNRAVAHLLDDAGLPSIRRVVKEPERWARIVAYAAERGEKLPPAPDSRALSSFVQAMRRTRPDEFSEISLAIVKLMGRGEYVSHAPHAPDVGHFGLATSEYTHATAPNRRYPDLVTQRLLKHLATRAADPHAKPPYTVDELSAIAAHCTEREGEAERVERQVLKSAAALLIGGRVGETFDAVVTGAGPKGTFVRLFAPAVEGKLITGGAHLAASLSVGARLRVRLVDTNFEKGFIDLAPA